MGIREPGDGGYTLHDARTAVSKAVETGEAAPAWALKTMVEATTEAALLSYVENFVTSHVDWTEELAWISAFDLDNFLTGLDQLRTPPPKPGPTPAEIVARIDAVAHLPWSGDHTYGDGVLDVLTAVGALYEGKPMPVMERFRCPSLYGVVGPPIRCELQLPHESKHKAFSPVGMGSSEWTDAQALNSATSTELAKSDDGECGEANQTGSAPAFPCVRPKRHEGLHRDETGMRWSQDA